MGRKRFIGERVTNVEGQQDEFGVQTNHKQEDVNKRQTEPSRGLIDSFLTKSDKNVISKEAGTSGVKDSEGDMEISKNRRWVVRNKSNQEWYFKMEKISDNFQKKKCYVV